MKIYEKGSKDKERKKVGEKILRRILKIQENEITEYFVYSKLAESTTYKNRKVLIKIANEEKKHFDFWKKYTKVDVSPNNFKVVFYIIISKLLGFTFALKLMEKGEEMAQLRYEDLAGDVLEAKKIADEEKRHEEKILSFLDEEKLKYTGSMVLGVNDALVELTGALAGLTLALQNAKLITVAGFITGVAASFSMGASEYLSTKAEGHDKSPTKAAIYTGVMYLITVFVLISPYYLIKNVYFSLALTLGLAIVVIFFFTFYLSVAKDLNFRKRFLEMVLISLGVSFLTFGIGLMVRNFLELKFKI